MDPERWHKVESIFNRALDAGNGGRERVLKESCAGDDALRREVESLLAQHETAGDFIETPAFAARPLQPPRAAEYPVTANVILRRYRIVRQIGSGGMGAVYEAEDLRLGRRVALKFLPEEFSADPEWVKRFRIEARTASSLNHANICTIYEVDEVHGRLFIAMELLEGQTLKDRIAGNPLPVKTVLEIGVQIALAIDAAHAKGIVHRDLKPANIFVSTQHQIKILDFGIAKMTRPNAAPEALGLTTAQHTRTGIVLGSSGYMSPEQVRGKAVDHRSDIFVLGGILYEMLTGKRAFERDTQAETMAAIMHDEPLALQGAAPNTPVGLQRVVNRCLEKTPERRFQSAADLAFALESLTDATTSTTIAPASFGTVRSHRRLWIAGVAIAMLMAAPFLLWWATRPPAVPIVEAITQITDDGIAKGVHNSLQTDGPRIYFNEGRWGSLETKQVAVTGGTIAPVPTQIMDAQPTGIAPDGSFLVVLPGGAGPPPKPAWELPLPTGEPVRIPMLEVQDAGVTPDGHLLLARLGNLYVADKDGSNPRKLALNIEGFVGDAAMSPDGRQIVFTRYPGTGMPELFLANSDGADAHLLAKSDEPGGFCCAQWVANGRYIVFETRVSARQDLWVLPMERRWLRSAPQPIRLTAGPLSYFDPIPSRDGKQIFALGSRQRGELVRYDMKSKRFVPILQGVSATNLTFSRDGKWVSYLAYPDRNLWRSHSDGTDRLQLASGTIGNPTISPDGQHVLFFQKGTVSLIGIDGAERRDLVDNISTGLAEWSPDGNQIVYWTSDGKGHQQANFLDLASGKQFTVSGSVSYLGARWISGDKLIAVDNHSAFMVLDLNTRVWSPLGLEPKSNLITRWGVSPDYKSLYYTIGGPDPELVRFGLADHKSQTVASLKDLQLTGFLQVHGSETQIGVAPDGSPVLTRDTGTQEIYALSVKWP